MSASAPARHSDEWHGLRRRGIGGSDIGVVAGVAPESRGSRFSLWLEKTGQLEPDHDDENEAMDAGTWLEPALAEQFTRHTGLVAAGEHMMLIRPGTPWARCEVDALVFDGKVEEPSVDLALGVLETKYANSAPWTTERCDTALVPPELNDLPLHYEAQVQWQLMCSGLERGWLGALHSWGKYRIYEIERDQEAIDALCAAASDFWELVETGTPPALGGPGRDATAAALAQVFGAGGGGERDVTDLAEQLASLRFLKREAKSIDEQITDISNVVKAEMGDAEVGVDEMGRPLVTWRKSKPRKRFDEKAFRAAHPDLAEAFTAEGEAVRTLVPLTPCPHCPKALRAQDVAGHMKKHGAVEA